MADTPHGSQPSPASRRRKRGVALVVVLGAMALIAFLVLTILTLNRAEQRAATNSAELTDVRNLADLPAQVVISQIRRATQNLGAFYNWTSQPGMIRVFSTETSSDPKTPPKLNQFNYPLYSTRTLYSQGPMDLTQEVSELAAWAGSKALFVDLNEPIEVRQDLRTGAPLPTANQGTLVYPILDPAAFERFGGEDEARIQGMDIIGSQPVASSRHQMPMPVRWLYVLSNGKILAPLPSSSPTVARFNLLEFQPKGGEPAPKIIGRIAFWTDDESCKINLNTATEPAPWHPPMTASERDRWAANTQPVRGETHRLSGHPAYTALSPVFRSFGGIGSPTPGLQTRPQPPAGSGAGVADFKSYLTAIHSLQPQAPQSETGSIHGTEIVLGNTVAPPLRAPPIYANVDELLFDSGLSQGTSALRQRNGYQSVSGYSLDEADIRRARFCLTTRSSAPETNPFNQPKVSLWPIQKNPAQRTRTDQLMALAATLGGAPGSRAYYGLQRDSAWNGTGSPGSSHSSNADLSAGSRNRQLFDWLKKRTSFGFPAHPGSFVQKYGALNRDQLLLSMFDLMRWSANPGNAWSDNGAAYDYLAPSTEAASPVKGTGMAVPLIADTGAGRTLRGPGRVPTITEAAIIFIATDVKKNSNNKIDEETDGPWAGFAKQTTKVRAFIALEPYMASPGLPAVTPAVKYVLKGLNGPSPTNPENPPDDLSFAMIPHALNGRPLKFGGAAELYDLNNRVTFSPSFPGINTPTGNLRRFGGDATSFTGLTAQFVERNGQPRRALGIEDPENEFPWFSVAVDVNAAEPPPFLTYTGGDLLVEIRHATTDTLLQEIVLPFTLLQGEIPMPRMSKEDFSRVGDGSNSDAMLLNRFVLEADLNKPGSPPYLPLIRRGDVVRAVTLSPAAPHRGDVRMAASRYRVPKDWYAPALSPVGDIYERHGLRETAYDAAGQPGSSGVTLLGDQTGNRQNPALTAGTLLPQAGPPPLPYAALPQGVTAALSRTNVAQPFNATDARYGDWETGFGILPDGPFFSRQDLSNAVSEENARRGSYDTAASTFTDGGQLAIDATGLSHTPQRQVSSAFIFGALSPYVFGIPDAPSTAAYGPPDPEPWRTLLFCPNPASRTTPANGAYSVLDHPGFASPFDHLWLEFFWTPVVEPTFLSPAFSTEGKINLNYQMIPFTWIERATAIHAALKGVRIPAIHHSAREVYKAPFDPSAPAPVTAPEILYEVDVNKTLTAFRARFDGGEVFIHPSEICNIHLFPRRIPGHAKDYERNLSPAPVDPATLDYDRINDWWNGNPSEPLKLDAFELTGDNLRESPYAQVYPRLCTRSNVFKVHYRVQLVSKSRSTQAREWNIETEKITAEQRGAVVIERYLDPNDPNIPDMTSSDLALDEFYRYRVLTTEPFTP